MRRISMILFLAATLAACSDDTSNDGNTDSGVDGGDAGLDIGADSGDVTTGMEPLGADNPPTLGSQIDRAGRPAISTALIATFSGDTTARGAAKDAFNAAGQASWADFTDDMVASMAILDSLDTVCGNQLLADDDAQGGRYSALAGILTDDQLYIHSDRGTCGTYLGLEAEIVGALPEGDGGCGGRTLSDDVIERSYSVLAAGILAGVDDGIAADDGTTTGTFPFLGAPQ